MHVRDRGVVQVCLTLAMVAAGSGNINKVLEFVKVADEGMKVDFARIHRDLYAAATRQIAVNDVISSNLEDTMRKSSFFLIFDNVWEEQHATNLLFKMQTHSSVLITTRSRDLLSKRPLSDTLLKRGYADARIEHLPVERLTDDESEQLLTTIAFPRSLPGTLTAFTTAGRMMIDV